jgi:dolichol-phosphate mannosyltransferase
VSLLLAVMIFCPVILWNARHEWVSFAFQSVDRLSQARRFFTHELLGTILALLSPLGVVLVWKALRGSRDLSLAESRPRSFARIYALVPLSVFLVFSLTHRVKLNWTGPLWLAVIPAMGAELVALAAGPPSWLRRAWNSTLVLLPIAYVAFLTHLSFGLPGIGYAKDMALMPVGWSEMGRALEARRSRVPVPANGRVLLIGLDRNFIASEAAYYHSRQREAVRESAGAHFFGRRALMYEFWFPPREEQGATLLLVGFDRNQLDQPSVRARCAPLGDIEQHWVERDGKRIRPYFTRVAENYRPP